MISVASFLIEIPTTGEEEAGVSKTLIAAVAATVAVMCAVVTAVVVIIAVCKCSKRRVRKTKVIDLRRSKNKRSPNSDFQLRFIKNSVAIG